MKKVAWWISLLFGPVVLLPFMLGLLMLMLGLPEKYLVTGCALFACDILIPCLIYLWFYNTKRISDMDITKRRERLVVFPLFLLSHFAGLIKVWYLGEVALLGALITLFVLSLLMVVITFFWKISVHVILITALWMFLINFFGFVTMWWFGIVVCLVMWSRIILKRHTLRQVLAGFLLSIAMLFFLKS